MCSPIACHSSGRVLGKPSLGGDDHEVGAIGWPRLVELYSGYADYQARAPREIPLVVLEPR